MRRLTVLLLTAALLYSGYWFIGARAVESQATQALADLRQSGWDVTYDSLNTAGFPNRFDTTLTNPQIAHDTLAWAAPFLQVFALSYRPNEVIAVFPNSQTLTLGPETFDITSTGLRSSIAVGASTDLPLRNITTESGAFSLTSSNGWTATLATALAALRAADDTSYDAYANITDIIPPVDANTLTGGLLPTAITQVHLDTNVTLTKPLDRHAGNGTPPQITAATLRDVHITWGPTGVGLTGALTFDARGRATGTLNVTVTDWATLLTALTNADVITPEQLLSFSSVARNAAGGNADLTVPVTVTDGAMSMGFIPLGSLPAVYRQ